MAVARGSRRSWQWASPWALLLGIGVALAVVGCGDGHGSDDPFGEDEAAVSANNKTAFEYFFGKGLKNFQSAGIVGNLVQESGMNPTAAEAGGPGRGIAQWSIGGRWDGTPGDNVVGYAKSQGRSATSLQLQLEFIWYELTRDGGYGLPRLRSTTGVNEATVVFEADFERCGECDQSARISYARAALKAFGSTPPAHSPPPPSDPESPTPSAAPYAGQFVSQTFPQETPFTMVAGRVLDASIVLKNTGALTWSSDTRLATTEPRDRTSVFHDKRWLSPTRVGHVTGSVAPGESFTFDFTLDAPTKPGTYTEHFGLVQDGVDWFSAPDQGGPPDNEIEAQIVVVPADSEPEDAGATDIVAPAFSGPAGAGTTAPGFACAMSGGETAPGSAGWIVALGLVLLPTRRRARLRRWVGARRA